MERYTYIDSLRAVAALVVICRHTIMNMGNIGMMTTPAELAVFHFVDSAFDIGRFGVLVFFAISGFVVPFTLLKQRQKPVQSFLISRFFRLYPVYWLSIPFGIYFFYTYPGIAIEPKTIGLNILLLQSFFGEENIMILYWTLQVELIFYALCVLFFCTGWLQKNRAVFVAVLASIAGAVILSAVQYMLHYKIRVGIPMSLAVMFWGILWRKYIVEGDIVAKKLAMISLAVFAVMIPMICRIAYASDISAAENWLQLTITYYSAIIAFIVFTKYVPLQSKPLVYLGTISYCIYLFGTVAQKVTIRYLPELPEGYSLIYILITMSIAIIWAMLVHQLIELPSMKLGRRLIAKLQKSN